MVTTIKNELSERLKACLKMEMLCAEVYHDLGVLFPLNLFPDVKALFLRLKESEEKHANILRISIGLAKDSELPEIIVPKTLSLISKTLNMARDLKAHIATEYISLKMALEKALEMEETLAESYLHDIMTGQTDSETIAYLKQFYNDEKSHAELIKEVMSKRGFLR